MSSDHQTLTLARQRGARKARLPAAIAKWKEAGVSPSRLSDTRHEALLAAFRRRGGSRCPLSSTLHAAIEGLALDSDMVVVIGWNVDEEPALLMRGEAIIQSEDFLRSAYVDGFVMINQPFTRALIVDFDERDIEIDEVRPPVSV